MVAPLIGISIPHSVEESAFGRRDSLKQVVEYAEAVSLAEGRPVMLPPLEQLPENILAGFDGLVLTGGGDISPTLFGQEADETVYGVSEKRDAHEIALIKDAEQKGIPILAICRGLQLINVLRGGTLNLHIDGHWQETEPNDSHHDVSVVSDSNLAKIIGSAPLAVNSFHHQSIQKLGKGLIPTAYAGEVIEAYEDVDNRIIAVQWHPEHMVNVSERNLALFNDLVKRAKTTERNKS